MYISICKLLPVDKIVFCFFFYLFSSFERDKQRDLLFASNYAYNSWLKPKARNSIQVSPVVAGSHPLVSPPAASQVYTARPGIGGGAGICTWTLKQRTHLPSGLFLKILKRRSRVI